MQHRLLTTDDERVAGVVAALKPDHRARAVGEEVDDLAFPLVAPLSADHYDVSSHGKVRAFSRR